MLGNSKNKVITVFMPVFNGDDYLEESLTAIEQQQLPDGYELEILVTDSGSSDNSLAIINSHPLVNLDMVKLGK
jgi:rhamnosyltransferase